MAWQGLIPTQEMVVIFLLVFSRILSLIIVLPVLGSPQVIAPVKVGLGFMLALIAFLTLLPSLPPAPVGLGGLVVAMAGEVFLGLAAGFTVRLLMEAVSFAGNIAGFQMGFTIANVVDPLTGTQISIMGSFLMLIATLIFVLSGLHREFIEGIIASFTLTPPGSVTLRPGGIDDFVVMGGKIFSNSVRIGAPWIIVLLLVKVGLGLMARTFPQMNIFFVGFPVTVAMGLMVFALAMPFIVGVILSVLVESQEHFWSVLKTASP